MGIPQSNPLGIDMFERIFCDSPGKYCNKRDRKENTRDYKDPTCPSIAHHIYRRFPL